MNEDKAFSNAKWFAIGLLVLAIIVLIFNFVASPSQNIIKIVSYSIQIILLLATAIGCGKKMLYGPVCGIVVSILLIISLDIISLIFGILYLIDCIKLVKFIKN